MDRGQRNKTKTNKVEGRTREGGKEKEEEEEEGWRNLERRRRTVD